MTLSSGKFKINQVPKKTKNLVIKSSLLLFFRSNRRSDRQQPVSRHLEVDAGRVLFADCLERLSHWCLHELVDPMHQLQQIDLLVVCVELQRLGLCVWTKGQIEWSAKRI